MTIVKVTLNNLNDMIIKILVQNNSFEFSEKANYFLEDTPSHSTIRKHMNSPV